jgi:hypothetical protein
MTANNENAAGKDTTTERERERERHFNKIILRKRTLSPKI